MAELHSKSQTTVAGVANEVESNSRWGPKYLPLDPALLESNFAEAEKDNSNLLSLQHDVLKAKS